MIPLGTKMTISIGRRKFIAALGGGVAAWALPARAQQPAMTRVGIVTIQPRTASMYAAFDQRLRELGYVEGQNLALDYVNPEHQAGGNAGAIEELLRWKVDIILVTYQSTLKAALGAGVVTVPIVMVAVDYDPLALCHVKSLARPGGNVTGLYLQQLDLAKKRVELLTQALPSVHAATVFWDSESEDQWKATRSAAAGLSCATSPMIMRKRWPRHRVTIAASLFSQPRRCFFATGSGSRTSRFGIKLHRCSASANGWMRVACFLTA